MRSRLLLSFALAAGSLIACNVPESSFGSDFCFALDSSCPSSGATFSDWIAGLPRERVGAAHPSGGFWEDLVPGDSVTLYFMSMQNGRGLADTVRTSDWAVTNSAVARISAGEGGRGTLIAIAPGNFDLVVSGATRRMVACTATDCVTISQIRVVAPPAPSVR